MRKRIESIAELIEELQQIPPNALLLDARVNFITSDGVSHGLSFADLPEEVYTEPCRLQMEKLIEYSKKKFGSEEQV